VFSSLEELLGDAHEERCVLEVLVALAHSVPEVQCAQARADARQRQGSEGHEVTAQHVLVVHVEGQVRQIWSAHVERKCLQVMFCQ